MARPNRGKQFEGQFEGDWKRVFPGTFFLRLRDNVSRYRGNSSNPCDFLCMPKDKLFMIETKAHYENRFPFSDLPQYELLVSYRHCRNVQPAVVIWFIDYDKVLYFPIETLIKMRENGLKSINLRHLTHEEYEYIEIPSEKLRVKMRSDYSILIV